MRPLWHAWGPEQNTVLEVEHVLEKSFLDLGKSLDSPLQVRCLLPFRHRQRHAQGRKRWRQGLSREARSVARQAATALLLASLAGSACVLCALGSAPWP
jgi:hypothetical protein